MIASSSAFTYKGRHYRCAAGRADLGVRYVLQGSVRKDGSRVRIAVQLTDASNGQQIWRERLDGDLQEVFALQDEIATQLSARIAPTLRSKEMERARRKPTSNLTAYDCFCARCRLAGTTARKRGLVEHAVPGDRVGSHL